MFGACKVGRPPDNASAVGVDGMFSANDTVLASWLQGNEETNDNRRKNKLCKEWVMSARRLVDLGEMGLREYSNYSLFEWVPEEDLANNRSAGLYYLYLRGVLQRATKWSNYFEQEMFKIKELQDVWLIATDWRGNFSFAHSALDNKESSGEIEIESIFSEGNEGELSFDEANEDESIAGEDKESCTTGTF